MRGGELSNCEGGNDSGASKAGAGKVTSRAELAGLDESLKVNGHWAELWLDQDGALEGVPTLQTVVGA